MDQESSTSGQEVGEQTRDPEDVRREIEQTRAELGDTVEELAGKADVKAQAKSKVEDVKQTVGGKKEEFVSKAKQASPESVDPGQAVAVAKDNPVPLALGALVVGFLLGRITSR